MFATLAKRLKLIVRVENRKFVFSLLASTIVLIVANQLTIKSMLIGTCASVIYLLMGGDILGTYLLKEEKIELRISLGVLTLLILLGLLGSAFLIFYKLGVIEVGVTLLAGLLFLVLLERFGKKRNALTAKGEINV